MQAHPALFTDLALIFAAVVLGGLLAWRLRQPLVLGYVVGGLLISPFTPGPTVSDPRAFEALAEVGVVLLMFSVGVDFSLRDLLRVRWVALVGGPLGMLLSVGLGVAAGSLVGWPVLQGVAVGAVVSVASTMVMARLLMDRGELNARHGQIMIGIGLVEDLGVVVLTVLLPALSALEAQRLAAIALALARAAAVLVPVAWLAGRVVPRLLARVAGTQSPELFLLVALAVALGTAALSQALGLSLALGAFLAGLVISESDYAHETLARLLPLRDVFVALFFVTVGALIHPTAVVGHLDLLAVLLALIVPGKVLTRAAVVRLFGYPAATAVLVGLGLAQIGEFSYVLVQVARSAGQVTEELYQATLAASLVSILGNALLVRWVAPRLGSAIERSAAGGENSASPGAPDVVLCGFGRVGSAIGEALETFGVRYAVIERDPDIVRELRRRGVPCFYGDAAHTTLLERAGAGTARLVIVALPEIDRARLAVAAARRLNPAVPVLARAHGAREAEQVRRAGATEVIQPEAEAAATLIRHALERLGLAKAQALAYLERLRAARQAEATTEPAASTLPGVVEVVLPDGPLAGQSLAAARVRERFGVTVLSVHRADGSTIVNPSAQTVLRSGDRLRVFGLPRQVETLLAEAARRP
ncbi:MAG TPA: cation:proton antiporter [Calidithermus sp.]|nr:cation:proton antiporter [Calidithermus sp.]